MRRWRGRYIRPSLGRSRQSCRFAGLTVSRHCSSREANHRRTTHREHPICHGERTDAVCASPHLAPRVNQMLDLLSPIRPTGKAPETPAGSSGHAHESCLAGAVAAFTALDSGVAIQFCRPACSCERPHLPSDLSHQHDRYLLWRAEEGLVGVTALFADTSFWIALSNRVNHKKLTL
jgi:hypothetical protein